VAFQGISGENLVTDLSRETPRALPGALRAESRVRRLNRLGLGESRFVSADAKVAVITGASSGIGEATARALVAAGYRVALLARRVDRIDELAAELGDSALAIEADVTDRDSLIAAAERVQTELGGADILVNNAGLMLLGPFSSGQRDDYRRMVETNLLGAITTTEVFLDQLRNGGGDLINISSVAGRTARPTNGVYAATKWGINGWSESLRQELQPEIRVTVIEPGAVATELATHITHDQTRKATEAFVQELAIRPEDIAEVILFALSRPRRMTLNEILVRPTAQAG
jgi:NADP-dependent 3-hydroxy acid dehydrogenase YdfG